MDSGGVRSNIGRIYGYLFFHTLIFAYVIERLFAMERGLSIQQMVYLEVLYMAIVSLLEIPTGALADKWNRKNVMTLSAFFTFFEFFILIFAYNFWIFALSMLSAAIAGALASGTLNSILYDSLKETGRQGDFENILARMNILDFAAASTAALLGGYMAAKKGYTFNYWISVISVTVSFIFALSLKNPDVITSEEKDGASYMQHMKEAFLFLKKSHSLLFIIFYGVIIGSVVNYFWEYYQVYNKEVGIPLVYFGLISACFGFLYNASGYLAVKLKDRIPLKVVLSAILVVVSVCFLSSSFIRSPWGLIPFFLAFSLVGAAQPLSLGYLHHRIGSSHRATIESFQSLALRVGSAIVGLLFGYFSTRFDIFAGFGFLGALALVYAIYYLIFQNKYLVPVKN
jgi:predicted MFS family arabinose efflux permease